MKKDAGSEVANTWDAASDNSTHAPDTPGLASDTASFSRLGSAEDCTAASAAARAGEKPRHRAVPPCCRSFWWPDEIKQSQLLERRCPRPAGVDGPGATEGPTLAIDLWRIPRNKLGDARLIAGRRARPTRWELFLEAFRENMPCMEGTCLMGISLLDRAFAAYVGVEPSDYGAHRRTTAQKQ
uniref:Uncharacterized protein n=1 Tax=Pyrodinium bahamense TaxID=73915 RepID=A0A7S0ASU1_9DINO|mmetsp:Transcript_40604/g.112779  ORF Transcript_40604/g.112779 Transcript_40604/m.112779 type:complete len:183 (+) Transcript_40604:95-643(+)